MPVLKCRENSTHRVLPAIHELTDPSQTAWSQWLELSLPYITGQIRQQLPSHWSKTLATSQCERCRHGNPTLSRKQSSHAKVLLIFFPLPNMWGLPTYMEQCWAFLQFSFFFVNIQPEGCLWHDSFEDRAEKIVPSIFSPFQVTMTVWGYHGNTFVA